MLLELAQSFTPLSPIKILILLLSFLQCGQQPPMDLRKRRTPVRAMASAAAAVPLSSFPEASPLTRFVQAGLTTVSGGFDITACFVKWSAAIQVGPSHVDSMPVLLLQVCFALTRCRRISLGDAVIKLVLALCFKFRFDDVKCIPFEVMAGVREPQISDLAPIGLKSLLSMMP